MPKIGVFREADFGEIQFLCGFQKMDKKLSVLGPYKN